MWRILIQHLKAISTSFTFLFYYVFSLLHKKWEFKGAKYNGNFSRVSKTLGIPSNVVCKFCSATIDKEVLPQKDFDAGLRISILIYYAVF